MSIAPQTLTYFVAFPSLVAAIIAGFMGKKVGRLGAHTVTILAVFISFVAASILWAKFTFAGMTPFTQVLYHWGTFGYTTFHIGFLIDSLTVLMLLVVTFVSLMVHIYTIGYMHDDAGYQRFFSYIAFFTFAMLMLVMSDNLLQLFFGWEGVGLASYLLIGFWYTKPTAIFANLKAFLVNRVGDLGFLLGIALVYYFANSLNYDAIFAAMPKAIGQTFTLWHGFSVSIITLACLGLFVGAMGKSAQMPLHIWLPDSMEGPTPISALIHAATMVTAGVFMVARFSPLFELSETARIFVLTIGSLTCFMMGLLGLIQNDIKRVIAYSTLSQLGYMVTALGASAYAASVFHLMTHAFFKALLFLGAGSVIMGMHHEQDIRKMGGLKRFMPITYITFWLGSLALAGIPPFAGFFSKDMIIELVHESSLPGAGFASFCVTASVLVTALYSFRLLFIVFHGKPRFDDKTRSHLKESPWVVTLPLLLLAIPSVVIGYLTHNAVLNPTGFLGQSSVSLGEVAPTPLALMLHAPFTLPFYLAIAGFVLAWFLYLKSPQLPGKIKKALMPLYKLLEIKYGFDWFNENVIIPGSRLLGVGFKKGGEEFLIDGLMVNGTSQKIGKTAGFLRFIQTGFLNHYVLAMLIGLALFVGWLLWH